MFNAISWIVSKYDYYLSGGWHGLKSGAEATTVSDRLDSAVGPLSATWWVDGGGWLLAAGGE